MSIFTGVLPAVTTPFDKQGSVDTDAVSRHARWLVDNGCAGVVTGGSLGEGGSLDTGERIGLVTAAVGAIGGGAVVATIASATTAGAVDLARRSAQAGCGGLMVLPPYLYLGDRREILAHYGAVFAATDLPCMLYNNPIAYGTDVLPPDVERLATEHHNLGAIKESAADIRRVTELVGRCGDRLVVSVGVDDLAVEAARAGATGWVAGIANAFPRESVWLFEQAAAGGDVAGAYMALLPLLRLDTVVKFVQLIKAVQERTGTGSSRTRAPRLQLTPDEDAAVDAALAVLEEQRPASLPRSTALTA